MIVWKLTAGFASDLRYEEDDYVIQPDEQSSPGFGPLPDLETLHDPAAVAARDAAIAVEVARIDNLKAQAEFQEMFNALITATPAQINNFVDNNVTDLASARTMFKRVLLLLSVTAILSPKE